MFTSNQVHAFAFYQKNARFIKVKNNETYSVRKF